MFQKRRFMFKATTRLWGSSMTYPQSHIPHEGSRCRFCHCEKPLGWVLLMETGEMFTSVWQIERYWNKGRKEQVPSSTFFILKTKVTFFCWVDIPNGNWNKRFSTVFWNPSPTSLHEACKLPNFNLSGFVGNLSGFCFLLLIFPRTWFL